MINLGLFYQNGEGVIQNHTKAIEYFKQAASLNQSKSINIISSLYKNGRNGINNYTNVIQLHLTN